MNSLVRSSQEAREAIPLQMVGVPGNTDSMPNLLPINKDSTPNLEMVAQGPLEKGGIPAPSILYQHRWFSAGFADHRRRIMRTYVISIIINLVIVWSALALVYGAYYRNNYLGKIKVFVVNFDGDTLGNEVVGAFQASLLQENHLDLDFTTGFASIQAVRDAVYDEQAWGAIVVNKGATQNLIQSLATGNSSYDPTSAIEVVSEGARNPLAANSHTVPAILAILEPVVAQAGTNATASFLTANAGNTAALHTALGCQQCFSPTYSYTQNDLRPATNATAFGAVLSGAVALIVFTFASAGTAQQVGMKMGQYLDIPSTIAWRFFGGMVAYFFTGLSITGVQAAYGMLSTSPYGNRAFMILWMSNWLTLSALGLSLEAVLTTFGWYITNWFLNFWVFWHSAAASYAAETMPGFYKYDYGFPLLHGIQATVTVVYGTKSHLARNFGVLIGWVIGATILMGMATTARLQWNKRKGFHVLP